MSVFSYLVAATHDDYDYVWSTSVEFDEKKRLVFCLDLNDYSGYSFYGGYDRKHRYTCTKAYLCFDDACRLARKLKISTLDLPDFLYRKFGYQEDVAKEEVQDTFKRLLNFVLSKGIHYQLHRCNEW